MTRTTASNRSGGVSRSGATRTNLWDGSSQSRDNRRPVTPSIAKTRQNTIRYTGVNLTGLEFNRATLQGTLNTHYFQHTNALHQYIAEKGFNVVRLPFCWERLQTELGGDLDATYKALIDQNITWAKNNGLKVILDCHSYGRYSITRDSNLQIFGDGDLEAEHLADLWTKLSTAYKNESGVLAYDIQNEPHDLTADSTPTTYKTATWSVVVQAVIDAIRANGDAKTIIVQPDWWSSVQNYLRGFSYGTNPDVWWSDPLNNTWLEFHCYFDSDNSGNYTGANLSLVGSGRTKYDVGNDMIAISEWAVNHGVQLYIGEIGVPHFDNGYLDAFNDVLKIISKYGWHCTAFAMGTNYANSVIALNKLADGSDRPQMKILSKYL